LRVVGVIGMTLCLAALMTFVAIGFWFERESLAPGLTGMFVFGAGLACSWRPTATPRSPPRRPSTRAPPRAW
jgi:hypothetical protein